MKTIKLFKILLLSILFSTLGLTSCVEEVVQPKADYTKILMDYMKANQLDISNVTTTWTIEAAALNTAGVTNYYIIDLRSATDYASAHIEGAVNSTVANVLTTAQNAGTKPIVVVCYTGQNAAYALAALRLSGYTTSKILKWGMSSWGPTYDKISVNVSSQAVGNANWSSTNTIKTPVTFSLPVLTATDTIGANILKERVQYMLTKGLQTAKAVDVLADPTKFFINNYWTEADVAVYGHIKGAYRLNETLKLSDAVGFKNLDANSTVLSYCWTGQTSAILSGYLTVLGYDAKSISFGANALVHANLLKNKWVAPTTDLPTVK